MKKLKFKLLLSTSLVVFASQASAIEFKYEQPTKPSPSFQLNFGTIALGALAIGVVSAMAGGGGDDDDTKADDNTADKVPDEEPDEEPVEETPEPIDPIKAFETPEYRRNWGLYSLNASSRYVEGSTGKGAIGAVFDSGADITHSEFSDRIIHTYSYFNDTDDVTDTNGHGTSVLGVAGAAKDGREMHGVAFDSEFIIFQGVGEATIMNPVDAWADATRKSADLGADVINHSWTFMNGDNSVTIADHPSREALTQYFGTDLFTALDYGVDHDLISVFAAGNSALPEVAVTGGLPLYFPEYEDHHLVVVSIDHQDNISSFSNLCGQAADFCLAAPGQSIYTTDTGGGYTNINGTSFSAPHVQGAALVLASSFPELTSAQITRILKDTARDLGDPGVDNVYGHGALDLENAVAPQGVLSFQGNENLNEQKFQVSQSHISTSGGMTKALSSSFASHGIMVTDKYDRGYTADLDAFVGYGADATRARLQLNDFTAGRSSNINIGSEDAQIAYASNGLHAVEAYAPGTMRLDPYADLVENPESVALFAKLDGGSFKLSHAYTGADSISDGQYLSANLSADVGTHSVTFGAGTLSETGSFVGTDVTGAFGSKLKADTHFISMKGDFNIGKQRSIGLGGSIGTTNFGGNGVLKAGKDIQTSSLGLEYAHAGFFQENDRLTLSVSRNLNVDGGQMQATIPTKRGAQVQGASSDTVEMTSANFEIDKTSAPIDLGLGYEVSLPNGRLAVGAAFRGGDFGHAVGSVGYSIKF